MEDTKIDQIAEYTRSSPITSPRDHHQLWVNLSALGEGNVFSTLLPSLLKHLLDGTEEMDDDSFDIILPSDNNWQTKIYYKLVEKQRMIDSSTSDFDYQKVHLCLVGMDIISGFDETLMKFRMLIEEEPKDVKLHEWNILSQKPTSVCTPEPKLSDVQRKKQYLAPITWTVSDLSKAGCLLSTPPLPVDFDDEQEMRRVYSLIYDVFRYKNVLMQALNDVAFFQIYQKLEQSAHHVWLLFYDLYHRSFKKRETSVAALASKLFDSFGLSFAENALWSQRVRLAAAVARLRIKHNALSLVELLPAHLKDEKVTEQAKLSPVTCWINCIKVNDVKELTDDIEKTFNLEMVSDIDMLKKNTFKWDRHCPQIMAFHSSMRGKLARSHFVKTHLLIAQDKSFCRGAATFGRILVDLGLTGNVIQTHVNSPRTTAYLATLLTHNEKIKRLLAFSAGKRKAEYEHYFMELGVTNIRIFSDRLIDSPPDASYMEEVVAVFATPPNSYSAVTDPIDLVCSRGGDLSMLEVLTESEETQEAKERVIRILEEQRKTLKFAMSRPQIQFVLYETHSELSAENEDMVSKTLKEINRLAKLQHAAFIEKAPPSDYPMDEVTPEAKIIEKLVVVEGGQDTEITTSNSLDSASSKIILDSKEKFLDSLQVPDTDLFTTPELPDLCPNENSCINFRKEGCYLSLIQRKEVIRLDDKYMIQMAENRGLFGSTTSQNLGKSKSSKVSRKKQEKVDKKPKLKKTLKEIEIDRIAAPTHTFLSHIKREVQLCRRCQLEQDNLRLPRSQYKKWWSESTRHIIDLKRFLIKHKLVPTQRLKQVKNESAQTSQESLFNSEESSSSLEENEFEVYDFATCMSPNSSVISSKNILGRFTSAHIRQFVSPDFKDDFCFQIPSLVLNPKPKPRYKMQDTRSRKKDSENVKNVKPKLAKKVIDMIKRERPKSEQGKTTTEKHTGRKLTREVKKMKSILERLCCPTLSFLLKTRRMIQEPTDLLEAPHSLCERFNRRHHNN